MYYDVQSHVQVNGGFTDEFKMNADVQQGSVLSPLLFVMVFEALSLEFQTGCPWELVYADDLVMVSR